MTLREKQSVFLFNVSKLIQFAYKNGYELTGGELLRTEDQQLLYFEGFHLKKLGSKLKLFKTSTKSKTMNSQHLKKLAIDINVFKNGKYCTDKCVFAPLAKYWSSLHPDNSSGYDWGWDYNHFQMK